MHAAHCGASIWAEYCMFWESVITKCIAILLYICIQYTRYRNFHHEFVFLPQFYCQHHLEGGIVHCLETRALQVLKDAFCPENLTTQFCIEMCCMKYICYLLPFQLYLAWGCDRITKITGLKYRLNVCSMSISSKYGSQRGRRICLMACTTIANLKLLCFPTPPCAELVWSQNTSWIRTPLGAFVSCKQLQKSYSREALFLLLVLPLVLQWTSFTKWIARSICQSSGDYVMQTTSLILKAT